MPKGSGWVEVLVSANEMDEYINTVNKRTTQLTIGYPRPFDLFAKNVLQSRVVQYSSTRNAEPMHHYRQEASML